MKIFKLSPSCLTLVLLSSALTIAKGQFTCTLAARDESGCLAAADDDGSSCVWCAIGGFGFCINEAAAEAAEANVPGITCDRSSPSDDTPEPPTDDNPPEPSAPTPTAPTSPKPKPHPKPKPPKTDDNIKPNDDNKVPNNFWNCLNHKSSEECKKDADGCTWCKSKAGYSICMSGPTADSAKHSKFFKCDKKEDEEDIEEEEIEDEEEAVASAVSDPYDPSCVSSYLNDPTQEGCTSTLDSDGNACEWCSLAGITNLCLNQDQANQGASLGITCQESSANEEEEFVVTTPHDNNIEGEDNLFDTSCVMTLLQDPTESACVAASDQSGAACQWCNALQGQVHVCLTQDQAELGQQSLGLECGASENELSLSAATTSSSTSSALKDPYDPSCMVAFLQDPTEEGCDAATDADGNPCEFCTIAGFNVCLTIEQAQMSQGAGATCVASNDEGAVSSSAILTRDYQDASCADAYVLGGGTSDACFAAVDEDHQPCQYCTRDTINHLCLTASQGDLISTMGFWCDKAPSMPSKSLENDEFKEEVAVPDDFFQCLQSYEPDDCETSGCTWCDSQVGIGFCTSDAVADSMKPCTFFDCQYKNTGKMTAAKTTTEGVQDFDSTCMNAGFSHPQHGDEACRETVDLTGEACVWCHTADNAVGLCFSQDQAAKASSLLECDGYELGGHAVAASE